MRTLKTLAHDIDLQDAVMAELVWDPKVDNSPIGVAAKDGAIVLSGSVTAYPQKLAAVRAAERVYGVKTVADDIQVVLPDSVKRRDAEIAQEIARERQWNSSIPDSVTVEVSKGTVTLRGEVEWGYQRDEAAWAVRHLQGVSEVANLIEIAPAAKPNAADIEQRIEEAIGRMADLDARSIRVTTSNTTVRLHGSVRSLAERRIAQRAAESAPGVTAVDNDIVVTP